MSDKILQALMQLFAIVANAERFSSEGRSIVENFLQQQISQGHINQYLQVFEEYREFLQGRSEPGKKRKRVSVTSVKVLKICTDINKELEQKQKYVVLIRLVEFVHSLEGEVTEQEFDFLETVAEVFHISKEEYQQCLTIGSAADNQMINADESFLLIDADKNSNAKNHISHESLSGKFWILFIRSSNILFIKYFGSNALLLNGQPMADQRVYVLSTGAVIRGSKLVPVYYSDVMRSFMRDEEGAEVVLHAKDIEYVFANKKIGLHKTNFSAKSGDLIGIMGGSGAGKSTMLNILNSNYHPYKGQVLVNGSDLHNDRKKLEGLIGYVPQDDLLMEDLTVFQNLYYNSKLCFGSLSDEEIAAKVNEQLLSLGLFEIKDLRVGTSLDKTISGGQRKRLNIALELIRKPMILFVDEPTSGLSSLDSENVMDLMKQLSLSGKLVFVVIHQPSSAIYKLFDKLLILDIGGYPIYYGNPLDALIYFKRKSNFVDADESECPACGNVNAEQIFSIIESKVMDEFGQPTANRKIAPVEWYEHYENSGLNRQLHDLPPANEIVSSFRKPSRLRQLGVFITRDVLSKLKNTQYLLINFLEAPLLAFILAYVLKYYSGGEDYIFRDNINLPAFIFISVLVAIFMGLTVSAEEIIRDRKILKREAFLNLSHSSYLISKMSVLFFISAIQTVTYVIIGTLIFGIKDLVLQYWLILFTASCFANMTGLNISAAFKSVVTIYILIPFLIIPQIILSGVMVKFPDLNPSVTDQERVPIVGEMMTARWAFEALAVEQFQKNRYEKNFFKTNKTLSNATYKKDFWLVKINDKIDKMQKNFADGLDEKEFEFVSRELKREAMKNKAVPLDEGLLNSGTVSVKNLIALKEYTSALKQHYVDLYNGNTKRKDEISRELIQRLGGSEKLAKLKDENANKSLQDLVLNVNEFDVILEGEKRFIRRFRPIYMDGSPNSFVRAPLYVSAKNVLGIKYSTFWVNFFVIWFMSLILMVTLYFNALKMLMRFFDRIIKGIF